MVVKVTPFIVRGRRVDVEVIFRNLLDNAVKYGGDPPQVEVTQVRRDDKHNAFRVTDNGRGIPVHQRWKVFARFVRLGSELERAKPGTGLGLYLVQTLVGRLKGRVRIRDREKGTGTSFEVTLPGKSVGSGE
jgi:signal transduction histidine kinase